MKNGISLKDMTVSFGALGSGVSFTAPRGTVTGIVGENGAGKSTVIRALAGILPYRGEAEINGKSVRSMSKAERQKIGYVGGVRSLPESLTLAALGNVLSRIFGEWDEIGFAHTAEKFRLPLDKPMSEFSTGMKALAALTAALSHGAETLLLDEPTSGLDIGVRGEVLDMIYEHMQNESHTVLMSSHLSGDLERICDRIVLMHEGGVVLEADKDELMTRYAVVHGDGFKPVRVLRRLYGEDLLVLRSSLPEGTECEYPTLDELLLFFIKGEKNEGSVS